MRICLTSDCGAAEVAPADRCLDRDAARASLAPDGRWTERLGHLRELPEWNLSAVMAVDEQRADRIERVPPIVAQPNDEIEATLPDPDL